MESKHPKIPTFEAARDEAAEAQAQLCWCAGSMCSGCEEKTRKLFRVASDWSRKWTLESPEVRGLVEALRWYDNVHRNHWTINFNDLPVVAQKALAAFEKARGEK